MTRRAFVLLAVVALVAVASVPAFAGQPERADVLNQGGAGVYAPDGASLVRTDSGVRIRVRIPTPEPGSYVYAAGTVAGHPEVYTAWAFVFNHPENCTDPCNGDDLGGPAGAAIYNLTGGVASGSYATFSGHIGVGQSSAAFGVLTNPVGAEIHVALAPHGALDPATLPTEFRIPKGSPFCGCWWVALFK